MFDGVRFVRFASERGGIHPRSAYRRCGVIRAPGVIGAVRPSLRRWAVSSPIKRMKKA